MIPVLVYRAPAWKDQLHRDWKPKRRLVIRHRGNVAFLPPPAVGYRIRHVGGESMVEVKPSRAPATVLARYPDAAAARAFLALLSQTHARPILREIGQVAS